MHTVPFYANREDNNSCELACLKSIFDYYGLKVSWERLEELTGYTTKKISWTVKIWTYCAQNGFDVCMIEKFNYKKYLDEGQLYLSEHFKPDELKWYTNNTNLLDIKEYLPEFLNKVHHINKSPNIKDIDSLLKNNYLVFVTLNSRILNGKDGFVSHAILIFDKKDDNFVAHDPGLPAIKNRVISEELLFSAMGGNSNTSEVTGVRKNNG